MKRIIYGLIATAMILIFLASNVYAYENNLYKMDIPSDYYEIGNEFGRVFMKNDNAITVITIEKDSKRDIYDLSDSEVKEFIDAYEQEDYGISIINQEKGKIGNKKAIHLIGKLNDGYCDMYIMNSNRHFLMVTFISDSLDGLNKEEYQKIKDSFVMKETMIDYKVIVGVAAIIIVGAYYFIKQKSNTKLKDEEYKKEIEVQTMKEVQQNIQENQEQKQDEQN